MKVKLPFVPLFECEEDDPPAIVKKPTEKFPNCEPEGCVRKCQKFFESYGKTISFALYGNLELEPKTVCIYARCCGTEILGRKAYIKDGELPSHLVTRIIPDLLKLFMDISKQEKEELKCTVQ